MEKKPVLTISELCERWEASSLRKGADEHPPPSRSSRRRSGLVRESLLPSRRFGFEANGKGGAMKPAPLWFAAIVFVVVALCVSTGAKLVQEVNPVVALLCLFFLVQMVLISVAVWPVEKRVRQAERKQRAAKLKEATV